MSDRLYWGRRLGVALAASALLGACSSGGSAANGATGGVSHTGGMSHSSGGTPLGGSSSAGSSGSTAEPVTWSEHIAPIAYRECLGCHRAGGIAPFALADYADAKIMAGAMARATASRDMPPMPVDGSGDCNRYANARWLTDREIALFQAWFQQGAPEGDPRLAPELPGAPAGLGRVDSTLDPGAEYLPNASGSDDYRCFLLDTGLTSDTFLVGYEVVPGDARVVHHAIVYAPTTDADVADAEALDRAEPGLGYTCFGNARVEASPRVLWAPGAGVTRLPEGTGLPLIAGRKLILQVHYNLAFGALPDRTRVNLQTSASVTRPAAYFSVADPRMMVAAGQALGSTTRTNGGIAAPVVIHGVLPHMHTLGRTLRVSARSGGSDTCLVNVDRWDFHWQNAWWYQEPLAFDSVASVSITCTYDTRGRTTPVTWGEGTSDEMCLSYLYVTGP